MKHVCAAFLAGLGLMSLAGLAQGQTVFFDDFTNGASTRWQNQRGAWVASGGVYYATIPNNLPPTYSSLPFVVADLDLEMDVIAVNDGGVWLHSDATGDNGVLLVTGGLSHTGTGFYWHEVINGGYGGIINYSGPQFAQGDSIHIKVTVRGDVYSVYLNGASSPATSFTTTNHYVGRVGLYDFTDGQQAFDNVLLRAGCIADIATEGSGDPLAGPDGFVTGVDFDVFVEAYFGELRRDTGALVADMTDGTGTGPPDDFLTGTDFDRYVELFFAGC